MAQVLNNVLVKRTKKLPQYSREHWSCSRCSSNDESDKGAIECKTMSTSTSILESSETRGLAHISDGEEGISTVTPPRTVDSESNNSLPVYSWHPTQLSNSAINKLQRLDRGVPHFKETFSNVCHHVSATEQRDTPKEDEKEQKESGAPASSNGI